jgi:riboflavin kinase/FMN adenylyltransferase
VRLLAPDGSLLAIAAVRDGRLAPDKVLTGGPPERAANRPRPERRRPADPAIGSGRGGHMRLVPGLAALTPAEGRLFVVVGVFDGLHLGHAYLLERLREEARRLRARPAVITFDAHPEEIRLGAAPPILVDPDERLRRLADAGVAVTVVQHFDRALRETSYDRFVRMITDRTDLAGLLMTPDAAFGHERRGTPDALTALGQHEGFEVVVVPPFELDGRQVRSADIRAGIAAGDLAAAERLLGRSFAVVGDRSAGATPDAPALTFRLPVALPPEGAYAVEVSPFPPPPGTGPEAPISTVAQVTHDPQRLALGAPLESGSSRMRVAFTTPGA